MRELFVYWKTAADAAHAAENEARKWQAELRREFPGLATSLYRRADEPAAPPAPRAPGLSPAPSPAMTTLMETYAGATIDTALEQRIVREGEARLGRWLQGPRKVEVFVRCPGA